MMDNINKIQIFNQIAELQKSLESLDKILFKIQCVSDSQSYVENEKAEPFTLDYMPEVALEKVKAIREIAMMRETTVKTMLDFYIALYTENQ